MVRAKIDEQPQTIAMTNIIYQKTRTR